MFSLLIWGKKEKKKDFDDNLVIFYYFFYIVKLLTKHLEVNCMIYFSLTGPTIIQRVVLNRFFLLYASIYL